MAALRHQQANKRQNRPIKKQEKTKNQNKRQWGLNLLRIKNSTTNPIQETQKDNRGNKLPYK
jgi:hypothetical protein